MNAVSFVIVIIGCAAVILEGLSSMLCKDRSTEVGMLNGCLGVIGIIFVECLRTGSVVLAPEFGAIMVQGVAPICFIAAALLCFSVLPVLCLKQVHMLASRGHRGTIHAVIGLTVGIAAVSRLLIVNPADLPELQFRMYDLWWPPMVVWLTWCFVSISLTLAGLRSSLLRLGAMAACTSALAQFALVHQELSDPQSRPLWSVIQVIALALLTCALYVPLFTTLAEKLPWVRKHLSLAWIPGLLPALITILPLFFPRDVDLYLRRITCDGIALLFLFLSVLIWMAVLFGPPLYRRIRRKLQPAPVAPPQPVPQDGQLFHASPATWRHRATRAMLWTSLVVIPFALADLLSVGDFPRLADFIVLLAAWLAFSAVLAAKSLDELPRLVMRTLREHPIIGAPALARLWSACRHTASKLSVPASAVGNAVDKLIDKARGWGVAFLGIVLAFAALFLSVAVGEMLHYNKLTIEPLTWNGPGDDSGKMASRIGDGIINELGNIRQEMLPVLLLSPSGARHSGDASPVVLRAVLDNGAVQAAMAKSSDIQLSEHVVIPVSIFAEPVQRLVRWALNVHAISGNLYLADDKKTPLIFLRSDRGESWKVPSDVHPDAGEVSIPNPPADSAKPGPGSPSPAADPDQEVHLDAWSCRSEMQAGDPVDRIVQEAAFDIASNDPSFVQMGMTRNWEAYIAFRGGLTQWAGYQSSGDVQNLNQAIACFARAFRKDNTFALAEYRAGIALESAGEYQTAIQAFDACLHADPSFLQAESAKAEALSSAEGANLYRPAIANYPSQDDRSSQATRLWAAVASSPDTQENKGLRIAAYYGLCTHGFTLATAGDRTGNKFYVNYFYCSRAESIYHQLSATSRRDPERVQLEAGILYDIADTLRYHDYSEYAASWPQGALSNASAGPGGAPAVSAAQAQSLWLCDRYLVSDYDISSDQITSFDILGSKLTSHALRYYRRASALIPGDSGLSCDIAAAEAFLHKDPVKPMTPLSESAAAHFRLAGELAEEAQKMNHTPQKNRQARSSLYYRRALAEYKRAADLAPTDFDVLNNFAYLAWQWELDAKLFQKLPARPQDEDLQTAEKYAIEAIRVSLWRQNPSQKAMAEDTLGEVLVAEGRNQTAIGFLRLALTANARSYGLDEVRWDLAQALTCDARSGSKNAAQEISEAKQLFDTIANSEALREYRPFTSTADSLDLHAASNRCFAATAPESN